MLSVSFIVLILVACMILVDMHLAWAASKYKDERKMILVLKFLMLSTTSMLIGVVAAESF